MKTTICDGIMKDWSQSVTERALNINYVWRV